MTFGRSGSDLSVSDLQLVGFFEVEPELDEYLGQAFTSARGEYLVEFGINPFHGDVSLTIARDGARIFQFSALGVRDVRLHDDGQSEWLEIVLSDSHRVVLELRPAVSVIERFVGNDPR